MYRYLGQSPLGIVFAVLVLGVVFGIKYCSAWLGLRMPRIYVPQCCTRDCTINRCSLSRQKSLRNKLNEFGKAKFCKPSRLRCLLPGSFGMGNATNVHKFTALRRPIFRPR